MARMKELEEKKRRLKKTYAEERLSELQGQTLCHSNFFRMQGYPIGSNARSADPKFSQVCRGANFDALDFKPCADSPLLKNSIAMEINLPGKGQIDLPGNGNIGAEQDPGVYEKFDSEFTFLYQNDWLPDSPNDAELLVCDHQKSTLTHSILN